MSQRDLVAVEVALAAEVVGTTADDAALEIELAVLVVRYVGVLIAPKAGILENGAVGAVVQGNVAPVGIAHRGFDGQVLEIAVGGRRLNDEHIAVADAL